MIDTSNATHAERELQNAAGRQTSDRLQSISRALINGANPNCERSQAPSELLLIEALNRGDVEVAAMLIAAGADLDFPAKPGSAYRMTPRQVMAGNLGDLARAEANPMWSKMLGTPRVANARKIAFLAAPQELAKYAETSPLVSDVLTAAKATSRETRLAQGWIE